LNSEPKGSSLRVRVLIGKMERHGKALDCVTHFRVQ
jgi:hypothetical protein